MQGSWTGTGVKRRKKPDPRFLVKTPGIDPTQRKDFGKRHVIISEKKDAKIAKYQVKDLPFPYTSKAQYEKSLDVPLGTEWNTRVGYQKAITPRVVTKVGTQYSNETRPVMLIRLSEDWRCHRTPSQDDLGGHEEWLQHSYVQSTSRITIMKFNCNSTRLSARI